MKYYDLSSIIDMKIEIQHALPFYDLKVRKKIWVQSSSLFHQTEFVELYENIYTF